MRVRGGIRTFVCRRHGRPWGYGAEGRERPYGRGRRRPGHGRGWKVDALITLAAKIGSDEITGTVTEGSKILRSKQCVWCGPWGATCTGRTLPGRAAVSAR